jgi:glycosyltransferase involved in cell wall biosynthesis
MTTSTSTDPAALVVVPTYNEHENLPLLVDGLMRHANVRLLVVDDQSPDGTGQLADELARRHPGRISVLHRTKNRGLGQSYIDALKLAIREPVDVICQMDADLSHDPAQLPRLIAGTASGDVVIGYLANDAQTTSEIDYYNHNQANAVRVTLSKTAAQNGEIPRSIPRAPLKTRRTPSILQGGTC